MLTPLEIYKKFLLKINKNDTNTNIKIDIGEFVLIFNQEKRQWLDDKLKNKENNDYIEDLESLLVLDKQLIKESSGELKDTFKLPEDFFRRATSYSICSKNNCKNVIVYNWFIKPKDINVLLQNHNQNPSFEYQETLAVLSENLVNVYKKDFTIDNVYLSYYKNCTDLDIAGYTNILGEPSVNKSVNLTDLNIEEIINRVVTEVVKNYENVEQTQIAMSRKQ